MCLSFVLTVPIYPGQTEEEVLKAIKLAPVDINGERRGIRKGDPPLPIPEYKDIHGGPTLTTVEYDVFACDAFQEDEGRWYRLMPDAEFMPS